MKKIVWVAAIAMFATACSTGLSKKDIVGKYDASMQLVLPDSVGEIEKAMAQMVAAATIKMDFQEDGTLTLNAEMFGRAQEEQTKWTLKGDSITLGEGAEQATLLVVPNDSGYHFTMKEMSYILVRQK